MTLEELQVVITAQTSGLKREINNVQRQLNGLGTSTSRATRTMNSSFNSLGKTLGALAKIVASVGVIKIGMEGAEQLNSAQASLNALNRILGEETTNALQNWADNTAKYLGLGRAEALKTAQFMGSILSGFINESDVAQATTQLIGQMGVMAKATGKPMEQIQEAIQSAFLGSFETVENILPTMTRALADNYAMVYYNADAFSKLTSEQQKFIMYQMIISESANMYGTSLGQNVATMNSVKASLADMKLQFGAAFTYILNVVMPVIQTVVSGLQWMLAFIAGVAQAIGKIFGKKSDSGSAGFVNDIKSVAPNAKAITPAIQGVASGLADASAGASSTADGLSEAEKNAKKLKGSLMGFDEINTLNMDTGTTGSLGSLPSAGGGGIDGVNTDLSGLGDLSGMFEEFNAFSDKMDKFKQKVDTVFTAMAEKIKKFVSVATPYIVAIAAAIGGVFLISGMASWLADWDLLGAVVGNAGADLMKYDDVGTKTVKGLKGKFTSLKTVVKGACTTVVNELGTIGLGLSNLMLKIPGLSGIGTALAGGSAGTLALAGAAVIAVIAAITGAFVWLWNNSESFRQSWIDVWNNIKDICITIWETILKPAFDGIKIALGLIWELGLKPLWEAWCGIWEQISGVITDFLNFALPIFNAIIEILGPAFGTALQILAVAFGGAFGIIGNIISVFGNLISITIASVRAIFSGIIAFITGAFTGGWSGAWQGVCNVFSNIFGSIGGTAKAILNGIISALNVAIRAMNKLKIPDWVPGVGGMGVNIPEIPRLAKGGVVNSGQMYIAGEAGREAIVPLEHNLGWAKNIGQIVAMELGATAQQGSDKPVEVVLQVGTNKLGRVVIDSINKLQNQEGRVLLNL